MLRWASLLLLLVPMLALAQRPPAVVPDDPDVVLERLPRGYAALTPSASGLPATGAQAERWIATAVRTGDARLVARAEAMLARIPPHAVTPQVLRTRAFAAQHRHDFASALELLDQLLRKDPRDADAHLTRTQIHLLQGRLDRARADCAALALGVDASRGLLCVAALALRRGDTTTAARVVDRWLAQSRTDDDESLRYVLVMRGEIASRADDQDADTWFKRALALAPGDVRTLAAYARHLRDHDRNREVLALLAGVRDHEGLLLQRALAAHALGAPETRALATMLARRYALARTLGSEPELRDEAEFLLTLRGDATAALGLALRNFETQRDSEDVALLQRAAHAARRPDALQPMQAWARTQQLAIPMQEPRR